MDSRLLGAALPLPSLSALVIPLVPSPSLPTLQPALAPFLLRLPLHPAHPATLPGSFPPTLSFHFLFGHLFLLRGFQEARSLAAHLHPSPVSGLEEGAEEFGKGWRAVSSSAFVVGADLSSAGVGERNGQRGGCSKALPPPTLEVSMLLSDGPLLILNEGCLPFQSTVVPL